MLSLLGKYFLGIPKGKDLDTLGKLENKPKIDYKF